MTRKEVEAFAQAEANILRNRVYIQFTKVNNDGSEEYSVAYSYQGMIETPSYRDPE